MICAFKICMMPALNEDSPFYITKQAATQEKRRTWDVLATFGVNLEQLQASCLNTETFLLGTPVKSLLLSAESDAERQSWKQAFVTALGQLSEAVADINSIDRNSSSGSKAKKRSSTIFRNPFNQREI